MSKKNFLLGLGLGIISVKAYPILKPLAVKALEEVLILSDNTKRLLDETSEEVKQNEPAQDYSKKSPSIQSIEKQQQYILDTIETLNKRLLDISKKESS